jgi:hypothetical protein
MRLIKKSLMASLMAILIMGNTFSMKMQGRGMYQQRKKPTNSAVKRAGIRMIERQEKNLAEMKLNNQTYEVTFTDNMNMENNSLHKKLTEIWNGFVNLFRKNS